MSFGFEMDKVFTHFLEGLEYSGGQRSITAGVEFDFIELFKNNAQHAKPVARRRDAPGT